MHLEVRLNEQVVDLFAQRVGIKVVQDINEQLWIPFDATFLGVLQNGIDRMVHVRYDRAANILSMEFVRDEEVHIPGLDTTVLGEIIHRVALRFFKMMTKDMVLVGVR